MTATIDLLAAVIRDAPRLPGAACDGRSDEFDPPESATPGPLERARLLAAVDVCGTCPALSACSSWVDSIPPRQRPTGVVAGRVFVTTGSRNLEIMEGTQ